MAVSLQERSFFGAVQKGWQGSISYFIIQNIDMEHHYDTVSNAINSLKRQGFTVDFNLEGNYLVTEGKKIEAKDFSIVDVYRYEGNTDPSDEAAVYAIESTGGIKGILVTGYGASSDAFTEEMLEKLKIR